MGHATEEGDEKTADGEQQISNFNIEYATSGRAKCHKCHKLITSGTARIYRLVRNLHYTQQKPYMKRHFHIHCFFDSFSRARVASSVITAFDQLGGIENMPENVQEEVR